jgi:hypothetical protein
MVIRVILIAPSRYKYLPLYLLRKLFLSIFDFTNIPAMFPRFKIALPLLIVGIVLLTQSCLMENTSNEKTSSWEEVLESDLNLLGHRNWILVVDKAFPEQSSPGMKYLYVEQDLIPTLQFVLDQVQSSSHVNPIIYRDRELSFIQEEQIPGIEAFRRDSDGVLEGLEVNTLLHDEVFSLLDESSSLFRVLVIKTNCTIPYTSVFLQLDCAYWSPDQEKVLRKKMSD